MTAILLVAGLTLLTSFLCSLFEAALYSVTPSQVELLKQREVKGARRLEALRADIDAPIAAILTANTIAHMVGSALCGAMVAAEFGSRALGIFATLFTIELDILEPGENSRRVTQFFSNEQCRLTS